MAQLEATRRAARAGTTPAGPVIDLRDAAGPAAQHDPPPSAPQEEPPMPGDRAWLAPVVTTVVCLLVTAAVVVAAGAGWRARAEEERAPIRASARTQVAEAIKSRFGAWPVPGQEAALPSEPNSRAAEVWLSGPVPDGTMRACEVATGATLQDVSISCADRGGRRVPF